MLNRRHLLALASALAFTSPVFALEEGAYDAAVFNTAQAAGKPILLHVAATWCETCHAQKEVIEELEGQPEFKDFTILTIDYHTEKDVMRQFGATQRSTLIAFKGDAEVGRVVAETSGESIVALMRKAL